MLIKEVTRRSNVKGVWQGVHSTNKVLHLGHGIAYADRPSKVLSQKPQSQEAGGRELLEPSAEAVYEDPQQDILAT